MSFNFIKRQLMLADNKYNFNAALMLGLTDSCEITSSTSDETLKSYFVLIKSDHSADMNIKL